MIRIDIQEVKEYILKVQGEIKSKKCLGKYSQQKTILFIIKDHKEIKEKKNAKDY